MAQKPLSAEQMRRAHEAFLRIGTDYANQWEAATGAGFESRGAFMNAKRRHDAMMRQQSGETMPGFEIARQSETRNADGEITSQSITQKPEPGEDFQIPDGHKIKGLSTLTDGQGRVVSQWTKTTAGELDPEALAEKLKAIFESLSPAAPIPAPDFSNGDLLTVYPIADAHIGMKAWGKETGENYDTDIAVDRLRSWIGRLVASSPASAEAIILDVGDTTHSNDNTNQTPASKHNLDADGRMFRTLELTIQAMADSVELALEKHGQVEYVLIPGNHNPDMYLAILFAMAERYRLNPRVNVRKDPREFWAHRFGDCLLAAHHGDKAKPERLVLSLADEHADDWGKTKHRFLWTGHLHHHKSADIGGVKWEQLRAMTAKDAYAASHAFTARSQLQAITLHRTAGEIQRQYVSAYSF